MRLSVSGHQCHPKGRVKWQKRLRPVLEKSKGKDSSVALLGSGPKC